MNVDTNGSIAESTVSKWSPVLEGIESDYTRKVTAQLLENQAKSIISERLNEDMAADIGGTNTVGRLGTFQKFAFPIVRRVYPELIANNIVGVQPMQGPVSQIFYLGNSRASVNGDDGSREEQTVYSKYNLTYRGQVADSIFSGANYDLDVCGTAAGTTNFPDVSSLIGGGLAAQAAQDGIIGGSTATSGAPSSTVGGQIANWPQAGVGRGVAAGPASLMGFNVSAGERLAGSGIPEMLFNIEQQPVAARTRKMRALWTLEASQDLKARL